MFNIIILLLTYFVIPTFLFQLCINIGYCLSCNNIQFPCSFLILMRSWCYNPLLGLFVFLVLTYILIILQNLVRVLVLCSHSIERPQAIASILQRNGFCLSGKVVALHLQNIAAKVNLCNQGTTVSFYFQTCLSHIALTNKHGILVYYTYLLISMWKPIIYWGEDWLQNGTFFLSRLNWHFNIGG